MLFKIGRMILKDIDLEQVLNSIEEGEELPVIVFRKNDVKVET